MSEDGVPGIAGEFVELRLKNGARVIGRLVPRDGCVLVITVPTPAIAGVDECDSLEVRSLPPLDLLRLHGTVTKIAKTESRAMLHLNACSDDFHWHPRFVERRRAARVRPSGIETVGGALAIDSMILRGRIRDLSIEGAAVTVGGARRLVLATPADVELMLHLPNAAHHLRFAASILRSEDDGESTLYAVRLDGSRSRLFALQQREIQSYSLRRQVSPAVPAER